MQKSISPGIILALLIVLVSGTFVGLAAAHGESGGQTDGACEMTYANEECKMSHDKSDSPMMDSVVMGGMMGMSGDCPMEQRGGMMRMHGEEFSTHHDC